MRSEPRIGSAPIAGRSSQVPGWASLSRPIRKWRPDASIMAARQMRREVERINVGRRLAEQTRETFVEAPPDRFRGQLKMVERRPGESAHAIVTDGSKFAVIPLSRDAKTSEGKMVSLSRDEQGRMHVRPLEKDRGIS
jgi:hypothetical protein